MTKKMFMLLTALVLSTGIGWAQMVLVQDGVKLTPKDEQKVAKLIAEDNISSDFPNSVSLVAPRKAGQATQAAELSFSWENDLTTHETPDGGGNWTLFRFMWYKNKNTGSRPCMRLYFLAEDNYIQTINNKDYPGNGTYTIRSSKSLWTVGNYSFYKGDSRVYPDPNNTSKYYVFNAGTVTVSEGSGNYPYIEVTSTQNINSSGNTVSSGDYINIHVTVGSPKQAYQAGTISVAVKSGQSAMGTVSGGGSGQGGDEIQISATANEGYAFKQWNDGNKENPRNVVVNGNQTYTAEFMEVVTIEDKNAVYTQGNGYFYVEGSTTGFSAYFESTQPFYTGNFTDIDKDNSWVQPTGGSKIYFNNATCKISRVGLTKYCLNATFSSTTGLAYNMIFYFDHIIDGDTDWDIKKSFSNAPDVYVDDNDENIWWITTPYNWETVGWEGWWSDFAVYIDKSQQPAGGGIPTGRYFVNYPATAWSVVPTMKYSISSGSSNPSYDGTIIGYYNNGWYNWFFAVSGYIDVYNDGNGHHTFSANFQNSRGNTAIENYGSVPTFYAVTATGEHGTVTGTGYFPSGATINLTAVGDEDYTFLRWSDDNTQNPRPVTVTGAMEFTAIFGSTAATHKVTFKNYDGSVLQEGQVEEEQTPAYTGATPTKESTVQYDYTFSGWNPAIMAVGSEDQVYTATFDETLRQYMVTVNATEHGTIIVTDEMAEELYNGRAGGSFEVAYGDQLNLSYTEDDYYAFVDWHITGDYEVVETPIEYDAPRRAPMIGDDDTEAMLDGNNSVLTIVVNGAVTIDAEFEYVQVYTMALDLDDFTTNGAISLSYNNATYTEHKTYEIPEGTEVTLTLSPENNGNYDGGEFWDADELVVVHEGLTWTFTMTQDMSVYGMCYIDRFVMPDTYASDAEYNALPWGLLIRRLVLNRSFKAKTWSTMCLPFACDLQGHEMEGMIYKLEDATHDAVTNKITVDFGVENEMKAGMPYMLYSKTAGSNPVFDYVELKDVAARDTTINGVSYIGVLGATPTMLEAGDRTVRFISGNTLYIPNSSGARIAHDRAYFTLPTHQGVAPRLSIRINGETLEEADDETMMETGVDKYISNGILYIHRNGTTYNAQGQKID